MRRTQEERVSNVHHWRCLVYLFIKDFFSHRINFLFLLLLLVDFFCTNKSTTKFLLFTIILNSIFLPNPVISLLFCRVSCKANYPSYTYTLFLLNFSVRSLYVHFMSLFSILFAPLYIFSYFLYPIASLWQQRTRRLIDLCLWMLSFTFLYY